MRLWLAGAIGAAIWLGCGGIVIVFAQDCPTRAITMIVRFPPAEVTAGAAPGR